MKSKKSQSAIEFMSMVGVGLILITITSIIGADYISSYFTDINIINGKQTVSNIVAASSLVYSQGIGAQTRIAVTIPDNVERNYTFISDREVNVRLRQQGVQDMFQNTGVNISGSFPLTQGKKYLYLKMVPSSIAGVAQGEVKVYLDDSDYSYIGVKTYKYTGSDYEINSNFSTSEDIYYQILITDINDSVVSAYVNVKVFNQNGALISEDDFSYDEFTYYDLPSITTTGNYILSIMVSEVNAVGTKVFTIS